MPGMKAPKNSKHQERKHVITRSRKAHGHGSTQAHKNLRKHPKQHDLAYSSNLICQSRIN